MTKPNTLIVMALPMENVDQALDTFGPILYTGVGKVNATLQLTHRLAVADMQQALPDMVVNLGTAGSHLRNAGELVACTQFVQRDMDVTALDFALGQTPFEQTIELVCPLPDSWRRLGLTEATAYTGDQFVTTPHAHFALDIIEMEAYALAKVCHHFKVPFVSLKYITDGADGASAVDWHDSLLQATTSLGDALKKWQAQIGTSVN